MNYKKWSKFILKAVIIIACCSIAILNCSILTVHAEEFKSNYKKTYEMIPEGTSLQWFRKNSISIKPEKNPNLFKYNKNKKNYELNPAAIPLDGKIYRFIDYKNNKEIFYKVLSVKASGKKKNIYEIEIQRAIYDGSNFIIENKPIILHEKDPLLYIYLKHIGKIGSTEPIAPSPEISEPDIKEPEAQIQEEPKPEVLPPEEAEQEEKEQEAPKPEVTTPKEKEESEAPKETEPELQAPQITEPKVPETEEPPKLTPEQPSEEMIITRLGGNNRIQTALAIADNFRGNSKLDAVILSSANDFPDALSGASLIYKYKAPILLVSKSAKQSKLTLDYISKNVNSTAEIIILGSSGGIDNSIVDSLKSNGFSKIKRLGGANRFETNIAIVKDLTPNIGSEVIISSASGFADALSISSISATKGIPIILTKKDAISDTVKSLLNSIKPSKIYITGSTGVISDKVENELKKYTGNIVRLGGKDRYETSVAINDYFKSELPGDYYIIALGSNFPDALAGTSLAYKYKAPILIVNSKNPELQKSYILNNRRKNIYVLGSTGNISDSLIESITK